MAKECSGKRSRSRGSQSRTAVFLIVIFLANNGGIESYIYIVYIHKDIYKYN